MHRAADSGIVHAEMVGDLLHGVNAGEESAGHGFAAVGVGALVVAERPGEWSALRAGDFPQPVQWSGWSREALDKAIAAQEYLVAKTSPDAPLLGQLGGTCALMARLMYGTGIRLMECVRMRVGDVDFGNRLIVIRDGKGAKDRVVPLPQRLEEPLRRHLAERRRLHEEDLAAGVGEVYLPDALARKYPSAPREWIWQYVFPSAKLSTDPKGGRVRPAPSQRVRTAAGGQGRRGGSQHREAGEQPCAAAFVCNPFAGGRLRHPQGSGAAGARGCDNDHDLQACHGSARRRADPESGRCDLRAHALAVAMHF